MNKKPRIAKVGRVLFALTVLILIWNHGKLAVADSAPAVKKASAKQLYEELVRRTMNVLSAPAEELSWSKPDLLKDARQSFVKQGWDKNSKTEFKSSNFSSAMSVYDDSVSDRALPPKGPLTNVPDKEINAELVGRTDNLQKTLYGPDRRMDLYTAIQKRDDARKAGALHSPEEAYVECAAAVGFILDEGLLQKLPSGDYYVSSDGYGQANGLCTAEHFWDQQYVDGIGTGFLTSPTQLCTAGHCVPDPSDVSRLRVIFGYCLATPPLPPSIIIKGEDVFGIKRVVDRRLTATAEDWAVLELDRACARTPLRLGAGRPAANSRVFAVGYPSGLPLKISPHAIVRSPVASNQCFIAAVDVCGGNSGSPVIAENTSEVEGILVRGWDDFRVISTGNCKQSVLISDTHAGETVCSMAAVKK
jgi:hypothetical protein